MNRWQQQYLEHYYKGQTPRDKTGQNMYEFLGKVEKEVTVHFPAFDGVNEYKPAHTETYTLSEDSCDMRNNIMSITALSLNVTRWQKNGYRIDCA